MNKKVEAPKKSEGTAIMACTCKNSFQDKLYGAGKRVHNLGPKSGATCTVCGRSKK